MPDRPTLTRHIGGVLLRHDVDRILDEMGHIGYEELRDSLTAVAWAYCDVDARLHELRELREDRDRLDQRVLDLEAELVDARCRLEQAGVEA